MEYENLMFERRGHVGVVTLNRPEFLNAMSHGLQEDTRSVCAEIEADDSLRAMVLTGAGRGFCAGADLSGEGRAPDHEKTQAENLDQYGWIGKQALAVFRMSKPTIAAVNGVAVGAGFSLALACDLRVGHPQTRFKVMFAERALSPDSGTSWFLPRIAGYSRALDLYTTNRDLFGEEAYRIGVLDRLVPQEQVLDTAIEVANQMAALPPLALRNGKRVIQWNLAQDLEAALRTETLGLNLSRRAVNDQAEQRAAWIEQRKGNFTGT
ncbi:MAG: enoyl-CoA hydratase/isomerase family protein [Dehalococcoidia bacterium]